MTSAADAMAAVGPLLFVLFSIVAMLAIAYGLFSDAGIGITTRRHENHSAREFHDMWRRGPVEKTRRGAGGSCRRLGETNLTLRRSKRCPRHKQSSSVYWSSSP